MSTEAGTAVASRTFEYAVRNKSGKVVKGRIEAPNQAAVAQRLRTMGVAPLSIAEVSTGGLNMEISLFGGKKVGLKDLAIMARQMSTMINAGLSLLRALNILAEQTENTTLAKILFQVRSDVESGSSLSASLGRHSDVFPPLMVNMIKAGEIGGFLDQVLISVAENYEAEVRLRSKIKSAMTYPVVVFCFAILAVVGMLLFIVPIFVDMFDSLGGALPLPTQMLVVLSDVMKVAAPILIVAMIPAAAWWRRNKNEESVRRKVDPLKLKTPIFGKLLQKVAISRFTRNFGTMIRAGVPILQALDIVGETSGNMVVENAAKAIKDSVRSGQSLSGPLHEHPVFPPMVVQMITVGEDTGALDDMLHKISQFYDQEVETTTEQLTSLIEPLMIAVLGSIVGGMIVALYMPIFSIFTLIE